MSGAARGNEIIVGGAPRAELLPPEVGQGVKARALRRLLVFFVILTAGIVAFLVVFATFLSAGSGVLLATANEETNDLLKKQAAFSEVRDVTELIGEVDEALVIGSVTEVRWKAYFAEIQASLPVGTIITNFTADTSTPTTPYAPSTVPLQGVRIGELTFTATTATLPDVEAWLNGLEKLTGFVDAAPGTIVRDDNGAYTVNIIMHVNSDVLDNPFVDDPDRDDDAAPAESTEED